MNTIEKAIERKMQLWTIIGPFITLLTICLIIIKAPFNNLYFPHVALLGLPLCWFFKKKGLAISLGILAGLLAFQFKQIPQNEIFWQLILFVAISTTFLITSLSFEEVSAILDSVHQQMDIHVEQLKNCDDNYKSIKDAIENENTILKTKLLNLEQEYHKKTQEVASQQNLSDIVRDELFAMHTKQEKLSEELQHKQNTLFALEKRLDESLNTIGNLQLELTAFDPIEITALREESNKKSLIVSDLEFQLHLAKQKEMSSLNDLATAHVTIQSNANDSIKFQEDQIIQQSILQEMNIVIENLSREKELLESTIVRLQTEVEILRDSDVIKNDLIESYEYTNKSLKVSIEHFENEKNELQKIQDKFQEDQHNSKEAEAHLRQQIDELKNKWNLANQEINDWKTKVSESDIQAVQEQLPDGCKTDNQAWRIAEGKYQQLRDQFSEKSSTLDATRQELFFAEEKVLALKKEFEEHNVYGDNENEILLMKQWILVEHQLEQQLHQNQVEIESLQELITCLCNKSLAN